MEKDGWNLASLQRTLLRWHSSTFTGALRRLPAGPCILLAHRKLECFTAVFPLYWHFSTWKTLFLRLLSTSNASWCRRTHGNVLGCFLLAVTCELYPDHSSGWAGGTNLQHLRKKAECLAIPAMLTPPMLPVTCLRREAIIHWPTMQKKTRTTQKLQLNLDITNFNIAKFSI